VPAFPSAHPEPSPALRRGLVALIYALAASLLTWRFLSSDLHYDSALVGLMVQAFLEGDFHVFFFGNNYMGTLDAVLAMPVLALFGSTTLALNFWPPVLYLGAMVILHRLLARFFGFWGVLVGLAYLALPPSYGLFFAGEARTHYGLGLFLSAWLMWISLRLGDTPAWRDRSLFLWGLVAGLAFWTNFLSATAILPCGLYLLWAGRGRLRPAALGWLALGGLIGAAPLIWFNASHGWPYLGLGGDLRLGPELGQTADYSLDHAWRYLKAVFWRGLPALLGVWNSHRGAIPAGSPMFFVYLLLLLGLAAGAAGLFWRGWRERDRRAWLPLAILALSVAAVVGTHYGSQVEQDRPRYLLWLYLPLPFCWAWLGQALARLHPLPAPALAPVLALLLCTVNLAGYADFRSLWGTPLLRTDGGFYFQQEAAYRQMLAQARAAGVEHLYADERRPVFFQPNPDLGAYELAFLAQGDPLVVDFWRDKRPHIAARVDAAPAPAFYVAGLEPKLRFLGLDFQRQGDQLFHGFREPAAVQNLLDLDQARAHALDGRGLGASLADGDLRSGFVTRGPARAGDGFVLDLGQTQVVAGLALVPSFPWEIPAGVRVEGAGDDGHFTVLRETPHYHAPLFVSGPRPFLKTRYARVECYFPPRQLRYLRVTHLGDSKRHWSVRQALFYGPGSDDGLPSWQESLELVHQAVARGGYRRIYADAWPSAHLHLRLDDQVSTLPANQNRTAYGHRHPGDDRPLVLDWSDGNGLIVPRRAADQAGRQLARAGVLHQRQDLGRYALFRLQGRETGLPLRPLAVSSEVAPQAAAALAQGRLGSGRWGSQGPQRAGVGLTLDLGAPRTVAWLGLDNRDHPHDFPRQLRALASDDGQAWRPVDLTLVGPLAFSGEVLLTYAEGQSLYRFQPAARARFLRLELAADDPQWWWSVQGLSLAAPAGSDQLASR